MARNFEFEMEFCRSILKRDAENAATIEMLAGFCTRAGRVDEGLELDQRFVALQPDNAIGHYNLACSLALKKRSDDAIATLRTAFEKGYRDFGWMMEDADLKPLHSHPGFSALLAEYRVQH
jgi:predicted Zn-dependent protease